MSCTIQLTIKNPQTIEGSSKLNKKFLELFNDPIDGTVTSRKYLDFVNMIPGFMEMPFYVDDNHPDRSKFDKMVNFYKTKQLDHLFDADTGELKLLEGSNGDYYFMNHKGKRLNVLSSPINESERVHLIKALAFSMIKNNDGLNAPTFVSKFLREKREANNAAAQVIVDKLKNKDFVQGQQADLMQERAILINQNRLIDSIVQSKFLINSIATGVSQEIKGANIQYNQELIKEESLLEEKDFSMGIESYTLASDEIRDDSTIDPEFFRILNTIPDFYYDGQGNKIGKTEPLFGMVMAKSANEVKNRVLDVVNNIIETEALDGTGKIVDAYENMIDKLNQHVALYNDETIKEFLNSVNKAYNSKSPLDKHSFKVKFFKSFNKGVNNFILTEIAKEKGTGEDRFTLKKIVLKAVDPSLVQNKRSLVSQEFINQLVYTDGLNANVVKKFEKFEPTHSFSKYEIQDLLESMNLYLNKNAIDLLYRNQSDLSKIGDKSAVPTFYNLMNLMLSNNNNHAISYDTGKQKKATTIQGINLLQDSDTSFQDIKLIKLMLANELRNTPISILANAEALTRPNLADSNYNIAGKSRWKYSNQSGINKQILIWQSGDKRSLLALAHKNLPYVDYLLAKDLERENKYSKEDIDITSNQRIANLRLVTNAQIRELGGNNAVEHKEILESDLMFDQMFKLKNLNDERWDKTSELGENDFSKSFWSNYNKTIATFNFSADKGGSFGITGFDESMQRISLDIITELFKGELNTMKIHSELLTDLDFLYPKLYNDDGTLDIDRAKQRQDYILQKLVPGYHYKTSVKEDYIDEDGNKKSRTTYSFNPELLESDDNIFHPELINEGEWRKFGFFNSFLQGNESNFDALFETVNGIKTLGKEIKINTIADIKNVDGRSINDIIRDGMEALLDENVTYIKDMIGTNLSNIDTNIKDSSTDEGIKNFVLTSILNNIQMFQMFNGDLGFFKQTGNALSMEDALKRGPAPMTDGLQFFNSTDLSANNDNKATNTSDYFVSATGQSVPYNPSTHAVVAVVKNMEFDSSKFDAQIEKTLSNRTDKRKLKPSYKAYGHEIADAGAYMTLEHYKIVKSKIYGWSEKDDTTFNNLLDPDYIPSTEDFHWLKLAGNTAQPVKLVGYEKKPIERINEAGEVEFMYEMPIFLKYAPAVLVPSLIRGTDVEKLAATMESQGVDQVVFKSGSKVSNPGLTTIHNSENDSFTGLKDDMVLNPFTFSYSALKWQVELPSHFDAENTIGNQHVKNLLANLDLSDDRKIFPYKKEMISAKDMYNKYSDTIVQILQKQSFNFLDKYGITFDANNQINFNNPKLREMLISQLDINSDFQLINVLKNNDYPLETIPGASQRLFPVLAGFIHKKVGKIRTNTGSVIQVANIGFDRWNGIENDVIYLKNDTELKPPVAINILDLKTQELENVEGISKESYNDALEYRQLGIKKNPSQEDLNRINELKESRSLESVYYYTDEFGNLIASVEPTRDINGVSTKGILKINNAKVMMPFASIQKKLNMSWEQFREELDKSKVLWEQGRGAEASISEELFTSIISYRIPNQAISSNDAMEIVGILPPYAGDQAYVYNEITAKAGSDFDVDKLYLMLPSFDIEAGNVIEHLYKNYVHTSKSGFKMFDVAAKNIIEELDQLDPENNISYEQIYNELKAFSESNTTRYRQNIKLKNDIVEVITNRTGEITNELVESFVDSDIIRTKKVKYSQSEGALKALQNELIELMGGILKSEATYDDLMSPLDSNLVKDAMYEAAYEYYLKEKEDTGKIEKGAETTENDVDESTNTINDDATSIMTFEEFKNSKKVSPMSQLSPMKMIKNRVDMLKAKKLVATMANHMTNVPIMQIQQMKFLSDIGLGDGDLGKIFMDDFKGYFSKQEYNDYTMKLTQVVSYFMNAAVDAAKDNYIIDSNFNSYTSGAAMLLIRSGMAPKEVFKLLLHPTIMEISNIKQSQTEITSNISLKNENKNLPLDTASLNKASIEYIQWLKENPKFKWNTSVDALLNAIPDDTILKGFWNVLIEAGKELNNEIAISKPDSAGAGKNLGEFSTLLVNLEKAAVGNIGTIDENGNTKVLNALYKNGIDWGSPVSTEFIHPNSPEIENLTFLGMMQNNSLFLTKKVAEGMFIEATPGYQYMLKHIMKLQGNPLAFSETSVKDISRYLYGYTVAQSNHPLYNLKSNLVETTIDYAIKSYKELMKNPLLKNNEFLKLLTINPLTDTLDFPNTKVFSKMDQSIIRDAFEQLYLSDDGNVSIAARRLIQYAYITTGFKPTATSFNQFLPMGYFIETGNHASMKGLLDVLSNPNNQANWEIIAETALIQGVSMNPRDYRNVVELSRDSKIEFGQPVTGKDSLSKLKTNAGTFVPFVFQSNKTGKKNKEGNDIYSNHLGILTNYSQDMEYPLYTELKLPGFDESGVEKTTKLFDPMTYKNMLFYKNESSTLFDTNNLSLLTSEMENTSDKAKDYYNYITPLNFYNQSMRESDNIFGETIGILLPLFSKAFGQKPTTFNIMDLVSYIQKDYNMSDQEMINYIQNSEPDQLITDIQNAEKCIPKNK